LIGEGSSAFAGKDIKMPLLNPFFKILDRCLEAIEVTSTAIGCALIAYLGQTLVSMMMMFSQKSPSLEIPMWIIYCIIPVSFLMMSVRFIQAGFAIQMDQRRLNLAASAG
jgi:TRAP-type C4-dicarboxylate transport system permease small subunit